MDKIFRHYVTAPERRMEYVESLGDKKDGCVFCDAVENMGETPAVVKSVPVAADFKTCMLIVNPFPYVSKGHLMVVPKRHIVDLNEMTSEEIDEAFKHVIPKTQAALAKEYKGVKGFNVGINIGRDAGASIEHLHVHIVPRYPNDVGFLEATASTRVLHEPPEVTMEKIAKHFKQ